MTALRCYKRKGSRESQNNGSRRDALQKGHAFGVVGPLLRVTDYDNRHAGALFMAQMNIARNGA